MRFLPSTVGSKKQIGFVDVGRSTSGFFSKPPSRGLEMCVGSIPSEQGTNLDGRRRRIRIRDRITPRKFQPILERVDHNPLVLSMVIHHVFSRVGMILSNNASPKCFVIQLGVVAVTKKPHL